MLRVHQNMVQEEPDAERPPLPAAAAIAAAPGTLIDDSVLAGPGQAALSQAGAFSAVSAFGAAVESPIIDHPAGLGQVVASQAAAVGPSGAEAASSASPAGNPNPTGTGDRNPYQTYMWEVVNVSVDRHYMVDPHQDLEIL